VAFFKVQATNQAPLILGLVATSTSSALIKEVTCAGENAVGSASRPRLYNPSTDGTPLGASIAFSMNSVSVSPVTGGHKDWSVNPAFPSGGTGAFNLPMSICWRFPDNQEFIVSMGNQGILYAQGTGGHLWTGSILFEER